jgi:hypothetical protein
MKRPRFSARERVSRGAVELGRLAGALAESGSKLEDAYLEERLATAIDRLLEASAEDALTQALDRLVEEEPRAHDELADMIEARAESTHMLVNGKEYDVLLVTAPILATSRFSIYAGPLPRDVLEALSTQMQAHLLAKDARFALADYLFSPDQLPRSFSDTWTLLRELGEAAVSGARVKIDAQALPETNRFLSDVRYLVGAVAVPRGSGLFRWHEADGNRDTSLQGWIEQGAPNLEKLLTGATFQPLLLDAYHSACRNADREARPYSIVASIAFLQATVGLAPEHVRAVVGPFYDRRLEEYRIGLGPQTSEDIYHGIVWPLLGAEDEAGDVPSQIEEVLRGCGVADVVMLDSRLPFEFCDECGVPLYPNAEGEVVHAEMPEEAQSESRVLH